MVLAFIYARVSSDDQNVDQQLDLCQHYCRGQGWRFRSYVDDGVSGKIVDRPGWVDMLSDAETKAIDGEMASKLVVVATDRITRDGHYAYHFLEWFDKINGANLTALNTSGVERSIDFVSINDPCDLKTPDGRFMFKLKCLLSERELDILRLRSRIGIERAKREGKFRGGKPGRKWKKKGVRK